MSDQPKKVVHLITVGISLLNNTGMSKNGVCKDTNRKKILDEISGAFNNLLGSSDFCVEEFKGGYTIKSLCGALTKDEVVPADMAINTIDDLNNLLKLRNLYNKIKQKKTQSPSDILKKREKLYNDERTEDNLKRLNRIALEEFYPQETPKKKNHLLKTKDENHVTTIVDSLNKLDLNEEMKLRVNTEKPEPANRFSAEITFLFQRQNELNGRNSTVKESVYLLPTDTNESKVCAEVTKQFINNHTDFKKHFSIEDIYPITGTGNKEQINTLCKIFFYLLRKHMNCKFILNTTGGTKSIVPSFTILGMLAGGRCELNYVERNKIEEMPSYPLGVDYHHYHRNAKRLKMALAGHESFKKSLSEQIKHLISDKANQLTVLGKQFKQRYEEQLKLAPIEVYSKEIVRILLPDKLKKRARDYRKILETVIDKSGAYIWTGDKIPEMVEHASRHHHHLLEFAELFLTPILAVNPDFLNAQERFCLIAGILLHDCGHSIDFIKTKEYGIVSLFPSEIRDLHHILAAQRLSDKKLGEDIGWISKNEFKKRRLNVEVYNAVMDACKYHRARMPYEQDKNYKHAFTGAYNPLIKISDKYNKKVGIDIMKIVALLRIIDSCDMQSTRPGAEEEIKIALNLFKKDYETLKIRAENAYETYKEIYEMINSANEFKKGDNYIDEPNFELKDNYMDFRIKCLEALKTEDTTSKMLARAWLTAAELIDKANMKKRQDNHYKKHQYIKEIKVNPSKSFSEGNFQFNIVLCPVGKSIPAKDKSTIEKDLSGEYKAVKNYLTNKCKMRLIYSWEGEGNPF